MNRENRDMISAKVELIAKIIKLGLKKDELSAVINKANEIISNRPNK